MDELEFTIKASPGLIEAIADRVIEKTMTEFEAKEVTYTVKEVAKRVNKTGQTIGNHIRKGLLKANKTGKSWTITEQHLNNYIYGTT